MAAIAGLQLDTLDESSTSFISVLRHFIDAIDLFKVRADQFDNNSSAVQIFRQCAGADLEIDWVELQNILNSCFRRGKVLQSIVCN